MKYLQKTWIRILVSLVGGGMATEIIHLSTGDPNRDRQNEGSTLTLIIAFVIFLVLSALAYRKSDKI